MRPLRQDRLDGLQGDEALDQLRGAVCLGEQVEVTDRLAPASIGTGRLDRPQAGHIGKLGEQRGHDLLCLTEPHPPLAIPDGQDAGQDLLLRLLGHALEATKRAGLRRPP